VLALAALGLGGVAGLSATAGLMSTAAGCGDSTTGQTQNPDSGGTTTGGDMAGGGGGADMATDPEAQRPS
jgi:hypothetical protein